MRQVFVLGALALFTFAEVQSVAAQAEPSAAESAELARAEQAATAAAASGRCPADAAAVLEIVAAARSERRPRVRTIIVAGLADAMLPIIVCIAPATGVLAEVPHGRFRPLADAEDESGSGDFDPQVAVRAINTRRVAIEACYDQELIARPTLAGRVTISLTIQETGAVTGVRATANSTGSAGLAACVGRVISGLAFSPGASGGSVTYSFPFVFEPTAPGPAVPAPPAPPAGRAYIAMPTAPSASGGIGAPMSPAPLLRWIGTRQPQLLACFEDARLSHPSLTGGRVSVQFGIAPTGVVTAVSATENTSGDPGLGSCVERTLRAMRSVARDTHGGAATFTFDFAFTVSP